MTMNLRPAIHNPNGAVVVGLTPDQRDDLRNGLLLLAAGLTVAGLGVGYLYGRNKGRESNPGQPALSGRPSAILRDFLRR